MNIFGSNQIYKEVLFECVKVKFDSIFLCFYFFMYASGRPLNYNITFPIQERSKELIC